MATTLTRVAPRQGPARPRRTRATAAPSSSAPTPLRVPALDGIRARHGDIDLALLPVNGLTIRPLLNRQVVMNAAEAAGLAAALRPRLAVPIHYAFTAGPVRERLLLKLDRRTTPFVDAVADSAPDTAVHVLDPGQPLAL